MARVHRMTFLMMTQVRGVRNGFWDCSDFIRLQRLFEILLDFSDFYWARPGDTAGNAAIYEVDDAAVASD